MHRSSSYSSTIVRATDEFSVDISSTLLAASSSLQMATSNGILPILRSISDGSNSKKEISFHDCQISFDLVQIQSMNLTSSTLQIRIHSIPET
ncbi:hypothetical protein MTR_4g113680 [Medicago truncatula]|uniref:Uncharacterized protein n=1 Tax=Medicago truncatula TaxID=3880 RepID=G7JV94_MEDTR|nr:hypothetical protein MTR_4g113680 [Medicago truncatula]